MKGYFLGYNTLCPLKLVHLGEKIVMKDLIFLASVLESGYYWGREALDPEPGRCRRTDGKKWRCSREAVEGQKYCERHMHRGRNRSRKPVEQPHASSSSLSSASFKHHLLHHNQ
ncbi:hypothetical protein VIGAN_08280800, partial [Vigna angularis var. angularis]